MNEVFVADTSIVTAMGNSIDEMWPGLCEGVSAIRPVHPLCSSDNAHAIQSRVCQPPQSAPCVSPVPQGGEGHQEYGENIAGYFVFSYLLVVTFPFCQKQKVCCNLAPGYHPGTYPINTVIFNGAYFGLDQITR